jgi:hypothetical protein
MAWEFFTIVDAQHDNPALYPVLGAQGAQLPVELDDQDGTNPLSLTSSQITLTRSTRGNFAKPDTFSDLKFNVVITDARVIVYCEKWSKGGGWTGLGLGGVAIALTANAVSKARAAARRRGRLLVGHVRYPWLGAVGGHPKVDWKTNEYLRLFVMTHAKPPDGPAGLSIELKLPKEVDSLEVAAEIARRSARWRLDHTEVKPEHREAIEALTQASRKEPTQRYNEKTKLRGYGDHTTPSLWVVHESNAYGTTGRAQAVDSQ